MIRAARTALALCVLAAPATADGFRLRTEFGLVASRADATALQTALGFQNLSGATGGVRLMWNKSLGDWRFEFHSNLSLIHGGPVAYAAALPPAVIPPATLFDLSATWAMGANTMVTHTIDRAWASYSTDNLVLKAGRQAITWGGGLVFHPSDIVAPFPPDAIDTTYKPGADMLYAQYLFDNGADIEAIAVPRALVAGGPVAAAASTYALRGSATMGEVDGSLLLARDRGDNVAGLSLAGPLAGATWNAEYVHWKLATGQEVPSWLFNISNFSSIGDMSLYYFAEYFHNGFGVNGAVALDALPANLMKRMGAGQVFLAGQDFLALGAQLQVTPEFSISPGAMLSLDDKSRLLSLGISYSLGDNTDISFNYFHPVGGDGTEFGGRETTAGSGIFLGPTRSATLRLVHFF